jgi:hypothetical protein
MTDQKKTVRVKKHYRRPPTRKEEISAGAVIVLALLAIFLMKHC